jgi:hypothetical protein
MTKALLILVFGLLLTNASQLASYERREECKCPGAKPTPASLAHVAPQNQKQYVTAPPVKPKPTLIPGKTLKVEPWPSRKISNFKQDGFTIMWEQDGKSHTAEFGPAANKPTETSTSIKWRTLPPGWIQHANTLIMVDDGTTTTFIGETDGLKTRGPIPTRRITLPQFRWDW